MHLGFHIYDLGFQSPDVDAAKPMVFATTLLLIALVVLLNPWCYLHSREITEKVCHWSFLTAAEAWINPCTEPLKILDPILDVQGLTLYYGAV